MRQQSVQTNHYLTKILHNNIYTAFNNSVLYTVLCITKRYFVCYMHCDLLLFVVKGSNRRQQLVMGSVIISNLAITNIEHNLQQQHKTVHRYMYMSIFTTVIRMYMLSCA